MVVVSVRQLEGALAAYQAVLDQVPEADKVLLGQTLNGLGVALYGLGNYADAQMHFKQALDNNETASAHRGISASYNNLGMVAMKLGDRQGAVQWYERAVRMHARAGDRTRLSQTYNNLGSLYGANGEHSRAEGFLRESIRIRADAGLSDIATGYANLGECLMLQGQLEEGEKHLRQALKLLEAGLGPAIYPALMYGAVLPKSS